MYVRAGFDVCACVACTISVFSVTSWLDKSVKAKLSDASDYSSSEPMGCSGGGARHPLNAWSSLAFTAAGSNLLFSAWSSEPGTPMLHSCTAYAVLLILMGSTSFAFHAGRHAVVKFVDLNLIVALKLGIIFHVLFCDGAPGTWTFADGQPGGGGGPVNKDTAAAVLICFVWMTVPLLDVALHGGATVLVKQGELNHGSCFGWPCDLIMGLLVGGLLFVVSQSSVSSDLFFPFGIFLAGYVCKVLDIPKLTSGGGAAAAALRSCNRRLPGTALYHVASALSCRIAMLRLTGC